MQPPRNALGDMAMAARDSDASSSGGCDSVADVDGDVRQDLAMAQCFDSGCKGVQGSVQVVRGGVKHTNQGKKKKKDQFEPTQKCDLLVMLCMHC